MRKFVFLSALIAVATSGLAQSFAEGFEAGPAAFTSGSVQTFGLTPGGDSMSFPTGSWHALNASTPIGFVSWYHTPAVFPARSGNVKLNVNYNSVAGANTIDNFFMSPPRIFSNGDTISFWTRVGTNPANFADRLILKLSTAGTTTAVANFSTTLVTINPGLTLTGYPGSWSQSSITLALPGPTVGRFALNYNVTNGGPNGANSDFVGIDDVEYTRAGMVESFDVSSTAGFLDGTVTTFGNSPGGNDIQFPSGTWRAVNASTPVGTTGWWRSNIFPPRTGAGLINANFQNTTGNNTINNFLMSPVRVFANGDRIRFWTRAVSAPAFADRLSLRLSTDGASTAPGAFTRVLLTVNPSLATTGYPNDWTQFTGVVSGLTAPATGRFALNYDVTNGGPTGPNSQFIGIDDVEHIPAPASQVISGNIGLSDTSSFGFVPGVSRTFRVEVRQGGNLVAANTFVATTPEPAYSVQVPFGLSGPCTVSFDGSSFLRRSINATLASANQTLNALLRNGDVDRSGEVDAADIDVVIASFGNTFPGPGNPDTDVDVSGEVDAGDIDIVISNFGRVDD